MTRERVEKAVKRMKIYLNEIGNESVGYFLNDGNYFTEAWMKTCEELEFEELDSQSQVWFIEDEAEFQERYSVVLDDVKKIKHMGELLEKNLNVFDDED